MIGARLAPVVAVMLAATLAASTHASAQGSKLEYEEGQLLVILAPDYPAETQRKGESGTVQVRGRVLVDGSLADATLSSEPANPALEAAVKDVLPFWRLMPRLKDCAFTETAAQVTIWFELAEGKPKVSFSRTRTIAPPRPESELWKPTTIWQVLSRETPPYPRKLQRNPNTPDVVAQLAYMAVGPDGTVRSVSVAPKRYHADFETSLVSSLGKWRFSTSEAGFCAEMPVNFRLR